MSSRQNLIIDGHLDLSMNAQDWNRDLTKSLDLIKAREIKMTDKPDRGNGVVNFESLRKGNIGICFATLISRYVKPSNPLPGWHSPEQAWAHAQGQLAWYNKMIQLGQLNMITTQIELSDHLNTWDKSGSAIGIILTLEGADSICDLNDLQTYYRQGLRAIGPAHYGPGTYAFGTNSEGGIGHRGKELLSEMENLGIILDTTHLCDTSFWQALDSFSGTVWASHSNCREIVVHQRQFSDDQIKELIIRDAVIGTSMDAWMLAPLWKRGISEPKSHPVSLENAVDHIDHICQLAGNSKHAAIGSDLDGGFGSEQCPFDVETIADLQKIIPLLVNKGFNEVDIENILSGNWLRILNQAWD